MSEQTIDQLMCRVKISDKRIQPRTANQLDSTAPSRRRGKERETPKPKKETPLRKHINEAASASKAEEDEVLDEEELKRRRLLHGRKFREFCRQAITAEINGLADHILSELVRFQDRAFAKDPVKAKIRRRLGFGFREVEKVLALGKVKAIILAPDIVANKALDETIERLIQQASSSGVPVVFALNRFRLARVCMKPRFTKISCVGVFNYDGCHEEFKELMQLVEEGKKEYARVWEEVKMKEGEPVCLFDKKIKFNKN